MTWSKNSGILGTVTCTQFTNTGQDELNPQTAYQTAPFITSNTTTFQTITFNNFDTLTKTTLVNTKSLTASSSSGLTVTLTSSNTNIATITGGNTLNAISSGIVLITATQSGDGTYDAAIPIICTFTITLEQTQPGPTGNLAIPISIVADTLKDNIKTISIVIDDIRYTQYSGISYGYGTGYHGSAMLGTITCTDYLDAPVTDFSDSPLNVTLTLANANTGHVYRIYKRNGSVLADPQPTGYPVLLTYVSGNNWTGTMTALSDVIVLDESPPSGLAGGDPYIVSVKNVKTLLPNEWKIVKLLETDTVKIIANCDFIDNSIISNLHFINKNKKECLPIDSNVHKWVKDLTYIMSIEFVSKVDDKKLIINTINGTIVSDSSPFLYELITDNKYGLYSITHGGYYPHVDFKKYKISFKEGYLTISIDTFWDDINYIQLYLNDNTYDNYVGELIEHSSDNVLFKSI